MLDQEVYGFGTIYKAAGPFMPYYESRTNFVVKPFFLRFQMIRMQKFPTKFLLLRTVEVYYFRQKYIYSNCLTNKNVNYLMHFCLHQYNIVQYSIPCHKHLETSCLADFNLAVQLDSFYFK
jgi:hypothetical protein